MVNGKSITHYAECNNVMIVNIKIKILKKIFFFFLLEKCFFMETIFFKFHKFLFCFNLYIYLIYNSISDRYGKSMFFFLKLKKKYFDYITERTVRNIFVFSKKKYILKENIRVKINEKHLEKLKTNNFFEYFLTNFYKINKSKKTFWNKCVSFMIKKNESNLYNLKTKEIFLIYANISLKILLSSQHNCICSFTEKKCCTLIRTFGKINKNMIFLNYKRFSNFERSFFLSKIFKKAAIYAALFSYIYLTKINI
ncbi:hypothetical protein CPARA_2gp308 (nucleomorph) [Cryptomonas paramecium]|uniref:Uncharacterized protein n=1 Tax=Cryptomonas paramaecium TaxID=2898 RepID=F2HI20_9CRYP|nr:hypothetical protein CPARA_2gp308 [Cryptomonas paramecium]AEA38966.1 hypothetical protein CPARA_2gp308 [Cryptomonas paramecium]